MNTNSLDDAIILCKIRYGKLMNRQSYGFSRNLYYLHVCNQEHTGVTILRCTEVDFLLEFFFLKFWKLLFCVAVVLSFFTIRNCMYTSYM